MLERIRNSRANKIWIFLAVLGPGIITAMADNDGPGIATYSVVGARYGYKLLWMLLLITFSLAVTQEMGARIGMVTGKGLGGLIREKFGLKLSFLAMSAVLVANLGTTIAEFAGVAAAMEIFGVHKWISVPIAALLVVFLINKADYRKVRTVFLFSAIIYIVYVISGFLAHPDWTQAARSTFIPSFEFSRGYLVAFIAVVGTTITPWGQFFIQSYVVDKHLDIEHLNYERADVFFGAFVTDFIAFFIMVACAATLFVAGQHIASAEQAAVALVPLAGRFASGLFAIGLLNASILAASILPLSSAYATAEAFGWEAGIDRSFTEARNFYILYSFFIIVSALIVMIPRVTLISIIFISQTINGILLPVILIYVLKIINDEEIMGDYVNGPVFNTIAWGTVGFIIAVTVALLAATLLGFA
ncbi:MAG: divalent metal cation transporter [Actinobacteria bacterium]|nr:MAG: divalent metal cation transporter [Actinomycetota bacterium]